MEKGYSDNRWVTFNQMEDKGWSFKRNEEGESLGKGAGVAIEFYELRDKETKKPFDRRTLDGMTRAEQEEYMDENVYPIRKYYRVFNGDVIEGIPERVKAERDESGYSKRAEKIIGTWSDTEARIYFGGTEAFYLPEKDEIHVPNREAFFDNQEFYSTTLHEIGHSTGHKSRLNRNLNGGKGTPDYAIEELRAEIASMFIAQDLELTANESHIQNNSAYIQHWKSKITENPNVLFTAIADAEKITKFVMAKENVADNAAVETEEEFMETVSEKAEFDTEAEREVKPTIEEMAANTKVEYYGVYCETDEDDETKYSIFRIAEMGCVKKVGDEYSSREECIKRFKNRSEYVDKTLQEITLRELQDVSTLRYSLQEAEREKKEKIERLSKIEAEKSEVFLPPSEVAGTMLETVATVAVVDMTNRGIDSLTNMDDRDIVERAGRTKHGEKFMSLFNGESPLKSEEQNERSLMSRTCTEYGRTIFTCQLCGHSYNENDGTFPTGHNYTNTIITEPNCTSTGMRRSVCDTCGDTFDTVIAANGHSYSITDVKSKNGITTRTYHCSSCGHTYKQELGDQYEEVSNYVEYLFIQYSPYMWWVLLAAAGIWSIVIGVMIAIAHKNEDKEKARKMLINYVIGLVVIAVIVVACPFLIRGIAALVT